MFLDSEPVLAKVCLVEAQAGPPEAADLRARLFAALRPLLDRGREQLAFEQQPTPLAAAATIALVAGVLQEQFVGGKGPPVHRPAGRVDGLGGRSVPGCSRGQAPD